MAALTIESMSLWNETRSSMLIPCSLNLHNRSAMLALMETRVPRVMICLVLVLMRVIPVFVNHFAFEIAPLDIELLLVDL